MKKTGICSKGLTFVEVMIAAGILAFALVTVLQFYMSSVNLDEDSRNLLVGVSHAQFVLEGMRSRQYSTLVSRLGTGYYNWDVTEIAAQGLVPLKNELIAVGSSGSDPRTITLTVSWQNSINRTQTFSVSTIFGGQ